MKKNLILITYSLFAYFNLKNVKVLDCKSPINERFSAQGSNSMGIIRIIKDFHHRSLHHTIEPCYIKRSVCIYIIKNVLK